MQVRATTRLFYLWMRYPGEEFFIPDHLYSKEVMEKVVPPALADLAVAQKEVKDASTGS
jgi:hypothetical protein